MFIITLLFLVCQVMIFMYVLFTDY